MQEPRRSVLVRITGRVQGVCYRDWTRRTAAALGLKGWVRNRSDRSVEALFSGDAARVGEMIEQCRQGPTRAQVAAVSVSEVTGEAPVGFEVRPTL